MNKEIISQGLMYLKYTFPNSFNNFTENDIENMVDIWFNVFKDSNPKSFKIALTRLSQKNKFVPSIAEIKKEIAIIDNPILELNAEDEWSNVIVAIRKYGSYEAIKALESLNPYTAYIVNLIGYNRLCLSTNIQWERKEFIDLFNLYKEKDIVALSISPKLRTTNENELIKNINEVPVQLLEETKQ